MKKGLMMFIAAAVLIGSLTGCGKTDKGGSTKSVSSVGSKSSAKSSASNSDSNKKLSVVCTIFPEYDWVKELIGDKQDKYDITYLMDKGVDLHSYQPSAEDIAKIKACDLFVYVGGESDGWVKDTLKEKTNENMQVVNLLETLGKNVKEEEVVEGMQDDDDHDDKDHDHDKHDDKDHDDKDNDDKDHDHEHCDEPEYDEHVWLSLRNASSLVNEIASKLQVIDPENKDIYASNAANYTAKLTELDAKYVDTVKKASKKTVLFGDRFPFRYLVEDYGLKYYAAFVGCSAETEASFETVAFLAKKVDELKLSSICVIENSNEKIAKTIIENTTDKNQNIVVMNSMQSVNTDAINGGLTYYSVMEENLKSLEKALK